MATGIISLVTITLTFFVWLWKRKAAEQADPVEQNREGYKQVDRELASRNAQRASAELKDDLEEIERLGRTEPGTLPDGRGSVGGVPKPGGD